MMIRSFKWTDDDYEAMVVIDNAVFKSFELGVEEWRHQDESRDPGRLFHRDMIELDGQIIAYGQYEQQTDRRRFFYLIAVHPEREQADIRPAYLEHVLSVLAAYEPQAITSGALEDQAASVEFLEDNGFRPVLRETSSELSVDAFDESQFSHVQDKIHAVGIKIVSIRELQDQDPEWMPKLYELFWTIMEDVPSTEPVVRRTLEEFEQSMLSGPSYNVDSWFVALDGARFVGMSQGRPNPVDPENMYSGLTGVVQSHRRQGIATALKLHVIAYAREAGIKTLVALNEEHNPMFQLNLALGFKPRPAWVSYEKTLA